MQDNTAQHNAAGHSTAYPAEVMPADSAGDVVAASIPLYGRSAVGARLCVVLNPCRSIHLIFFSSFGKQSFPLLHLQNQPCCFITTLAHLGRIHMQETTIWGSILSDLCKQSLSLTHLQNQLRCLDQWKLDEKIGDCLTPVITLGSGICQDDFIQ